MAFFLQLWVRGPILWFFFLKKPYSGLVICTAPFQRKNSRDAGQIPFWWWSLDFFISILGWKSSDVTTLVQIWGSEHPPYIPLPNLESETPRPNSIPVLSLNPDWGGGGWVEVKFPVLVGTTPWPLSPRAPVPLHSVALPQSIFSPTIPGWYGPVADGCHGRITGLPFHWGTGCMF